MNLDRVVYSEYTALSVIYLKLQYSGLILKLSTVDLRSVH